VALFILIFTGHSLQAQIMNQPYYCELRGSFFIEEYPDRADFLVFEEDSEAFADLLVFETDNSLFAEAMPILLCILRHLNHSRDVTIDGPPI
jgi:hypothetical protein